ncbi:MAG TPA: penicillin-binding transpeptidase domain-containing protein, partial [Holophagaceae bacterium]|nr:penicillin-binding transpeptidase domain-containing protein [Holophagaceae bacterium]
MSTTLIRPPRRLLGRPEAEALSGRRLPWLMGGMMLWAAAIFLRLVWLQVIEHRHYANRAEGQHLIRIPIMPIRGELRDRKGDSLAISLKVESLFCDPRAFYPSAQGRGEGSDWGKPDRRMAEEAAAKLAPILEMPKALVLEKLLRKKPFVWVERQLPPSKVAAIKALELDGLDFQAENRRFYPRGSLACQILGFTNIDGQGQLGIEQAYDSWLAGREGKMVAARDAHGKLLALEESYPVVPVNGSSIQLSLDATIQHIVEEALAEGVAKSHPKTAYAVVVDPNTGEILAMAGTPTFDPNQILPKKFRNRSESEMSSADRGELRAELERQKAARKVHPVEDAYEPGSTMKIFTASIALEERKVHLGEKIDCGPGRWDFGPKNIVTDTHKHGVISFEEVLWQSSNIGA